MNRGGEGESTASSVVPTDRNRKNSLRSRCRQITGSSQLNFSEPCLVAMSCLPFSKPWMPGNQFEAGSPMCTSLNSVTHLACLGFELLRKVHFGGSTQVGVSEAKADLGYSPYHVHILQIDLKLLSHFVYLSWYSPRQEMSRKCIWLVLYHSYKRICFCQNETFCGLQAGNVLPNCIGEHVLWLGLHGLGSSEVEFCVGKCGLDKRGLEDWLGTHRR